MGVLAKIGLYEKADCLYAKVGSDGAVLVGIRSKDVTHLAVPEKIGKLTVRGIANKTGGVRYSKLQSLSEAERRRVLEKLGKYTDIGSFHGCTLPETLEYIGA